MSVWLYSIISVMLVSLISFVGLFTLSLTDTKLKNMLLYFVSFSAGALFGDAFFHLLPEVTESSGFTIEVSVSVIAGIALSFLIEKIIHWRHCHFPQSTDHVHPFAIMNLIGDAVHNFIDGLIIVASYLLSIPVGLATTLAVILHEIPQEIGDFGVLLHGGYSNTKALFYNFLTALTALVGAVVGLIISTRIENMAGILVPFAAGTFVYIAGSDLIPELHKEVKIHKSALQLVSFLAGILIMVLLRFVE